MPKNASLSLQETVKRLLEDNPEIRPFPAAVARLVAACQDPNATSTTFEKIIECDPALAMRVLRMANSPFYGIAREIRSVAHAAAILGIRQLRSLALSIAGAHMFDSGKAATEQRKALCHHSLGCAIVARLLARFTPSTNGDDAFLAGIFHDIGKLLLFDVAADEYRNLASTCAGADVLAKERALFGIDHQEIGLKSAHSWRLEENIKVSIGFHHAPLSAPAHTEIATLIHVANNLAKSWRIGSIETECHEVPDEILDSLCISREMLVDVHEETCALFEDALRAFTS